MYYIKRVLNGSLVNYIVLKIHTFRIVIIGFLIKMKETVIQYFDWSFNIIINCKKSECEPKRCWIQNYY